MQNILVKSLKRYYTSVELLKRTDSRWRIAKGPSLSDVIFVAAVIQGVGRKKDIKIFEKGFVEGKKQVEKFYKKRVS